jgi:hypothetical protein
MDLRLDYRVQVFGVNSLIILEKLILFLSVKL